jgi:hypothetical protein
MNSQSHVFLRKTIKIIHFLNKAVSPTANVAKYEIDSNKIWITFCSRHLEPEPRLSLRSSLIQQKTRIERFKDPETSFNKSPSRKISPFSFPKQNLRAIPWKTLQANSLCSQERLKDSLSK